MTALRINGFRSVRQIPLSCVGAEISFLELIAALDITECLRLLAAGLGPAQIAK
jgi:hypothetical protein